MKQSIVVKYQTEKHYCSCCNQKLPSVETSKVREFEFSKDVSLSWVDWDEVAQCPEEMENMVSEFVYETINFFATNSTEKIIVEDSEIEKVKEFILREVIQ